MVGHPVGRSKPHLPPISNLPETLVVQRSDITAYCLNPFSFNIIHDPATMRILDAKVQEFGERFGPADHVDEPPMCWAMVNIDNRWHRTHLLEKYYTADAECYGAEVCLIDSGRRERLNIDRIFPMPPEVLTAAPAQSLRIFPKDIQRPTAPSICELFEYCLEARFRLTFDDFSTSGEQRPYLAGIVAEVEVGHKEWISLRQLLLLPTVRDGGSTNGGTRTTSEIHSNDNASARLNHTTANGQPFATPPQNDISGPREDDEESDAVSSDEESCTDSPDQERENRITYKPSATGDPVDLEGENLGIVMTRKTLENARKTERRNVFRSRPCFRFRSSEGCRLGNLCPHPHENLEESTQAAAGTTFEFRDYPDIKDLKKNFTAFGVCTHVDEKGFIYLVLPYGVADIWTVLELRGNLDLEFREIRHELSRRYDHQLEKKRTPFNPIDNLAVVWVEKSGSGALHNVPQGWYRARVRQREGKHCEVFLVDHGAILRTSMENLFPLEDDLCDRKQQTIRCQITGTELSTEPGKASEIYEALRNRILTFKVYKHEEKFDVYQVQMFSVSESKAIHHGEDLIRRNILKSIQPVD